MSDPRNRPSPYAVTLQGDDKDYVTKTMLRMLTQLACDLRTDICANCDTSFNKIALSKPSHGPHPLLTINFYSSPAHNHYDYKENAYCQPLGDSKRFYETSDELLTIYDENDFQIAEFGPRDLYILFNLLDCSPDVCETVLPLILADYLDYTRHRRANTLPIFKAKIDERRKKSWKKRFETIYLNQIGKAIKDCERQIKNIDPVIIKSRKTLLEKSSERNCLLGKINGLRESIKKHDSFKLETEFETMRKLAVDGIVKIDEVSFVISVGQIDIAYEGVTYDIGKFDIQIYPNGDNGGVCCHNRSRVIRSENHGELYHPHVRDDGGICFGSIEDNIVTLITQMEYAIVAQIMIDFLKTCNENDWYQDVTSWPIKGVSDEKPVS